MTTAPDPAEAGFLAALRANPADDTARLAYADWLGDRDDPRAELLRLAVEERGQRPAPGSRGHNLRLLFDPVWVSAAAGPVPTPPEPAGEYGMGLEQRLPGCVVFLLSRAGWLRSSKPGEIPAAESFARTVNRALAELITACDTGLEKPRAWIEVGFIGYGTDRAGNAVVGPLFSGPLAGRDLVTIPELYDHPLEIERRQKKELVDDGAGGSLEVVKEFAFPLWYRSGGGLWSGSPMCAGLDYARRVTARWALDHPDCFPPFVIHMTDGSCTDGDPSAAFRRLRAVSTADGGLFLVNALLTGPAEHSVSAFLPASAPEVSGALRLFEGASPVPARLRDGFDFIGHPAELGCRALAVNTDPIRVLLLLPTGTSPPLYWARSRPPPYLP